MSERTKWTDEQWEAITGMKRVFWFQRRQEREKQRYWWKESSEKSPTKKIPWTLTGCWCYLYQCCRHRNEERIAQAISEKLEENPGSANIQRQLTLLEKHVLPPFTLFALR